MTTRTTPAALITRRCGADHVFSVKGNAPETFDILDGIDWEPAAASRKSKARLEQRVPLKGLINYPGQIARIKRYREPLGKSANGAASSNDCTSSPRSMRNTRRQRNCCGRGLWKT